MIYSTNTHVLTNRGVDLYQTVKMIAESGFPAIDLSLIDCSVALADDYKDSAKRLRSLADSLGFVFNQSHAPFGGGFEKYSTKTREILPRILEFSGLLGIETVVVHPLQKIRYYGQEEHMFELNMEFYSALAPYAKNCGVKIGIENMWQQHPVTGRIVDDIGSDPCELVRYYDTLNDPDAFTVCLDIGHVALCGREPEDAVKVIGHDRLGALHVHDVDYIDDLHTLPGLGKLKWDNICRALGEIDYKGDFTLESNKFMNKFPLPFAPVALRFMNDNASYYSSMIDSYRPVK